MFRNTGANAFAIGQTRLAYEDKRDLYCIISLNTSFGDINMDKQSFKDFLGCHINNKVPLDALDVDAGWHENHSSSP